jgi:SAM-dependent methyltransferase
LTAKYRFAYAEDSVYGAVMALLDEHAARAGVIVDLGCGYGAIAERCRQAGWEYLGVDVDNLAVKDLSDRGFEALAADLNDGPALIDAVRGRLGDRQVAAVTMLDTLEHLVNGPEVLACARTLVGGPAGAPLVLSVPNVAHADVVTKLLLGRWDMTDTGLLDATHVSMYSALRLAHVVQAAGWREVGEADFPLVRSDQFFPEDLVLLQPDSPVAALLRSIADRAGAHPSVNQFVRAYLPAVPVADSPLAGGPFLSVLLRTQCRRMESLHDTLLCLSAQTCSDFEVLISTHDVPEVRLGELGKLVGAFDPEFTRRIRFVRVTGGTRSRPLNESAARASGRYLAVLDDDDLVFADWVETFREVAEARPGAVLRTSPLGQDHQLDPRTPLGYRPAGGPSALWPKSYDLLDHLLENRTPVCALAVPSSCFRDLGLRWDEDLLVLEDWEFSVRCALLCGVAQRIQPTSLCRHWVDRSASRGQHSDPDWERTHQRILAEWDSAPLLLPAGSLARIESLYQSAELGAATSAEEELGRVSAALEQSRFQLAALASAAAPPPERITPEDVELAVARAREEVRTEFRSSTSWRITAPLRALLLLARLLRRAR